MKKQAMVLLMNIIGTLKFTNGAYYSGYWDNSKRHGKGKFIKLNEGKSKDVNGVLFDGLWKDDKKEGKGKDRYVID